MRSSSPARRTVILAAGKGTRMRREHAGVALDAAQRETAARGTKALIPFHGQPFLGYVLTALADGGITEACIVVGPGDDPIRRHFSRVTTERMRIEFAEQQEPLGSANAVLAAEPATAGEPFILINSDNLYPAPVIARVRAIEGSGMAGFRAEGLVAGGLPAERIAAFALVTTDARGDLAEIIEKPGAAAPRLLARGALVSMTCWRFGPSIFDACRAIAPSGRHEYELPAAVALLVARGERFEIIPLSDTVLDLTSREDVPRVSQRLRDMRVRL